MEYHTTGEAIPLSWGTIAAYAQCTHEVEEPWEFRALIKMSRAYHDGKAKGSDLFCMPPHLWGDEA